MSGIPVEDASVHDDIKECKAKALKQLEPYPQDKYTVDKVIATTLQGNVKLVRSVATNEEFALKVTNNQLALRRRSSTGKRVTENVFRELSVMASLPPHDNVVTLHEAFTDEQKTYLVMDYCARGELYDMVEKERYLHEDDARTIMKQIVSGVVHLHQHNVVHLDMSLENVFVTEEKVCKIGDFGVARECKDDADGDLFIATIAARPGKLNYMAPEIYACQEFHGKSADVFSLGVMLFTMLFGFPPFEEASSTDMRYRLIGDGELPKLLKEWKLESKVPSEAVDLLSKMLAYEGKRISLEDVLAHPWMNPQQQK